MLTALLALNVMAWAGAAALLLGSVTRLLVGRACGSDEFLAALSLISALLALFFARRLFAGQDEATLLVLSVLSLLLAAYVYRLGWGRGNGQ